MRPDDVTQGRSVTLNRTVNTPDGEKPAGTTATVRSEDLGGGDFMLELASGTQFRMHCDGFN